MLLADIQTLETILTALYLPGLSRAVEPPRRRWPEVESAARSNPCSLGQCRMTLEAAGLHEEAFVLSTPGLLVEAERLVSRGSVLTAASETYPPNWALRLGRGAPPAVWIRGRMPRSPMLGVVGSRDVPPSVDGFCKEVALQGVRLGFAVLSGGAPGCDRAAIRSARHIGAEHIEIIPCGLSHRFGHAECQISLSPPSSEFSTSAAMERNGLLYSLSEATVVAHARLKVGGSWVGSTEALRKRRCRVITWDNPLNPAARVLIGLGAAAIASSMDISAAMVEKERQQGLFSSA